jgi:hypothetical protein
VNKVNAENVPYEYNRQVLNTILQAFALLINGVAEGRIGANYNATTSAPTTGDYQVGDIVRNSNPSELGSASSKYVLFGWICTASSPLTFKELRCLTGN